MGQLIQGSMSIPEFYSSFENLRTEYTDTLRASSTKVTDRRQALPDTWLPCPIAGTVSFRGFCLRQPYFLGFFYLFRNSFLFPATYVGVLRLVGPNSFRSSGFHGIAVIFLVQNSINRCFSEFLEICLS